MAETQILLTTLIVVASIIVPYVIIRLAVTHALKSVAVWKGAGGVDAAVRARKAAESEQ